MHTDYPTANDLKTFLLSAGLTDSLTVVPFSYIDYTNAIVAARQRFEGNIGRRVKATTQTRKFNTPTHSKGYLPLDEDLLSVTSLTVSGVSKTLDTDFFLIPVNAPNDGEPYHTIQFAQPFRASYPPAMINTISIVGLWGLTDGVPEDCWDAILADAGVMLIGEYVTGKTGAVMEWREGDTQERYASGGLSKAKELNELWTIRRDVTVNNRKRVVSYLFA